VTPSTVTVGQALKLFSVGGAAEYVYVDPPIPPAPERATPAVWKATETELSKLRESIVRPPLRSQDDSEEHPFL
jgi:hypothetical protein